MCMFGGGSSSPPPPPEPQKPQEVKQPDTPKMMADARTARKKAGGMGGGTLLTGSMGAAPDAGMLGKTTLLGQ